MLTALTIFHVVLSLVGLLAGFVVVRGLLRAKRLNGWTTIFLTTTAATSVTGFLFPFHEFLPSHGVGIVSLAVLGVAILARYRFGWQRTYAVTAITGLYLNLFVLVVQLFLKVPALNAMAPTQSEPPFQIAQLVVLALFVALAIRAAMKVHREPPR